MSTFLNKYSLKQQTIEIMDKIDEMIGKLMSTGCSDDATGNLRAEVYSKLKKCHSELGSIIQKIH